MTFIHCRGDLRIPLSSPCLSLTAHADTKSHFGYFRVPVVFFPPNWSCMFALVMRTQGSLRLILNTKLWAQMQIDKASEKSIRITAMDTEDQGVKVFLISVSSFGLHLNIYTEIGACLNCS